MSKPFSVYQHWDPLTHCVVGRSYAPEFYSWITNNRVRSLFEKIAIETEEDYQSLIEKLQQFGVQVLRPNITDHGFWHGKYLPPPMTPRDYMVMIGEVWYENYSLHESKLYNDVKDPSWPDWPGHIDNLPTVIRNELVEVHGFDYLSRFYNAYQDINDLIKQQGNKITSHFANHQGAFEAPGAYVSRIGKDLYFGTNSHQHHDSIDPLIKQEFDQFRSWKVHTSGHADSVYCPVCPGLIISLKDVPTYAATFPGWEVVYLPNQSWDKVKPFLDLKRKNKGRWWIPGYEYDQSVIDLVETWLGHWTGYVEETVFDVNMLVVDPKNVIVLNYNKIVFDALERYGISAHVVPFRHRYFWDGGIHCVTADINRVGTKQDYFPERT